MVPMRDGVKLHTVVVTPDPQGQRLPSVLIRTPYNAFTFQPECVQWADTQNYNCLMQDFRGRYASQGRFDFWLNSSTDGFDTMAWLTSQKWSNGKVFTTGVSANGIAQYVQPISNPPWLLAESVTWATAQLHKSVFQVPLNLFALRNLLSQTRLV